MKKFITLIITAVLLVSCTDYDSQFDQLDAKIAELAAANDSLEAEIAAMAALNATVSAQTTATLEGFQKAVEGIIEQLTALGTTSQDIYLNLLGIMDQISALADLVASNTATQAELDAAIAEIQAMLDLINENVIHHSGGGSTSSSGTEHHSGGGHHHSGGGSTNG
jgi:outer membrane murein-binding lipoprotein Lpp